MMEQPPADAQHHWPVPTKQGVERGGVVPDGEPFQQLPVVRVRSQPLAGDGADVPEHILHRRVHHTLTAQRASLYSERNRPKLSTNSLEIACRNSLARELRHVGYVACISGLEGVDLLPVFVVVAASRAARTFSRNAALVNGFNRSCASLAKGGDCTSGASG